MITKLIPLLLVFTLKSSRCSLVIDSEYHQGLYLSDYCPKTDMCEEGVHVMCMMYDPHRKYGPNCLNWQNISMTADLAIHILEVINEMRSRIAKGKETGKNDEPLPRGYGLFRFNWDSELATFAQVATDLCYPTKIACKATRKFPRPGFLSHYTQTSFPYWKNLREEENAKILTADKLVYAINGALSYAYKGKGRLTKNHIKSFTGSEYTEYVPIINGRGTHVGCGISGYMMRSSKTGELTNVIYVLCYFSVGTPSKNTSIYETKPPPPGRGYSQRCGCPPGALEDEDCLCNEVPIRDICTLGESSGKCDPTLVLLPIFTMEDAPPEKLYQLSLERNDPIKNFVLKRIENSSDSDVIKKQKQSNKEQQPKKVLDLKKDKKNDIRQGVRKSMSDQTRAKLHNTKKKASPTVHLAQASKTTVRPPRRPSKPPRASTHHFLPPPPLPPRIPPPVDFHTTAPPRKHRPTKKFSTLTNITQSHAATRKKTPAPLEVLKEVVPRQNNLHKAVNSSAKHTHRKDTAAADLVVTENRLHKSEEVVKDFNEYLKPKNNSIYNYKNEAIKENNDNFLLSLLDTLEQKVKHITLDDKEREILDIKLRKIYGTIIGKTAYSIFTKPFLLHTDPGDVEIEFGNTDVPLQHTKHHEIDKQIRRVKGYGYLIHKRNNKLSDDYNIDKPTNVYSRIYNDDLDHSYDEIDNQYIKYLERKHRKKTDNNFNHEHNDLEHKFKHYLPASRKKTFEVSEGIFNDFGNENEKSQEEASRFVDFHKDSTDDRIKLIARGIKKRKRKRKIHRSKDKSSNSYDDFNGQLDLDRRKYYQDKLNNVKKMLRSFRKGIRNSQDDWSTRRKQKKSSIFA